MTRVVTPLLAVAASVACVVLVADVVVHVAGVGNAAGWALSVAGLVCLPVLGVAAWSARRGQRATAIEYCRAHERWESVCQTTNDVVWELDPSGVMTFLNDAARRLFALAPQQMVGRSMFAFIHSDDVERVRTIFTDCVARKNGWERVRVRVVRSDGRTPWVESSGVAHVAQDGRLVGFTATTREIEFAEAERADVAMRLERVETVLAARQLRAELQPIFSLETGRVIGAEALARFPLDPPRPPDRWFATAHEVGRGVDLEMLAIEKALEASSRLDDELYVSLNVSPSTLSSGRLPPVLEEAPVGPHRIVLELTEHVSIEDYDALAGPLTQLRGSGVRLAVDDAGAGFASFRHILRLRPDIIKLDQTLTRGINADPAQRALAAALVMFALEVRSTTVVAEGVETAEELATVATLGIDAAQGFYLGRPTAEPAGWAALRHTAVVQLAAEGG